MCLKASFLSIIIVKYGYEKVFRPRRRDYGVRRLPCGVLFDADFCPRRRGSRGNGALHLHPPRCRNSCGKRIGGAVLGACSKRQRLGILSHLKLLLQGSHRCGLLSVGRFQQRLLLHRKPPRRRDGKRHPARGIRILRSAVRTSRTCRGRDGHAGQRNHRDGGGRLHIRICRLCQSGAHARDICRDS